MAYLGTQPNDVKKNIGLYTPSEILQLTKEGSWGGSLELIEEQNPSSETTIDFTNIQENVFDVHYMTWALNPSGDDTGLVRLSIDNGSSFVSSGYQHAEQFGDAGGTFTEFRSTSASFFARLGDSGGAGANELHNGYMYFYNLGNSSFLCEGQVVH